MQVDDDHSDREDRDDRQSEHSDRDLDHDPEQPPPDPEDGRIFFFLFSLDKNRSSSFNCVIMQGREER